MKLGRPSKKIGKKYGRLCVLKTLTVRSAKGRRSTGYKCRCDCGKIIVTTNIAYIKSCGCLWRETLAERNRKELGYSSARVVWNYYLRNAKDRNLKWKLTFDQFRSLIVRKCVYCKVDPSNLIKVKGGDQLVISGVDRVNNDNGYTIGNVVPCCKICNRAKRTMNVKMFMAWIKALKEN